MISVRKKLKRGYDCNPALEQKIQRAGKLMLFALCLYISYGGISKGIYFVPTELLYIVWQKQGINIPC